jgi:pyruvate/2-oxoglutarate dehydrogenase complex dihydrolipoamide acyltransferase (E2) component
VHEGAWHLLRGPVRSVSSADSVIPAAPHLERDVLLSVGAIVAAVRAGLGRCPAPRSGPARSSGQLTGSATPEALADAMPEVLDSSTPAAVGSATAAPAASPGAAHIVMPKLNNNDDSYLLVSWLVADGQAVQVGEPVADVETSKATQELIAEANGVLRQLRQAGTECRPGEVIAVLSTPSEVPQAPRAAPDPSTPILPAAMGGGAAALRLSSAQRQVAEVVTASHRDIPAAFAVSRMAIDRLLTCLDQLMADTGTAIGLAEVVIKAIGNLRADHPLLFATLQPDWTIRVPASADIGVTVDVGNGLCIPVLRDVGALSADDVADQLTDLRMRALRGRLAERDLAGANIAVSLNTEDGMVLVQPIIPPGLAAIVSVAGVQEQAWPDGDGLVTIKRTVDIGRAYDHRRINGKEATAFLSAMKRLLEQPGWLTEYRAPGSAAPGLRE